MMRDNQRIMNGFISYNGLPVSSGGAHALNRRSPEQNYIGIKHFLSLFSDTEKPTRVLLEYAPKGNIVYAFKLWIRMTFLFGFPKWNIWDPLTRWVWTVSGKAQENAFILKSLQDGLESTMTLTFLWHFHFRDPKTGEILAGQEEIPILDQRLNNSRIYLRLGALSTVSVWFAFPFTDLSDMKNRNYLEYVRRSLPFKASDKHWQLWRLTEQGNWMPKIIQV